MKPASFHGLVDDQILDASEFTQEANESVRVECPRHALQGRTPSSRIGVGELSFVYVEVTYPALSVQRRKLLACPLGDVGNEEVIQNDVGKRCCRQVALAHLGKRSLEHLHLTDDINGLITLVARSDH